MWKCFGGLCFAIFRNAICSWWVSKTATFVRNFLRLFQVCDYFDDEIDDQPDLTLNENDQPPSYRGTPASEFPPTTFGNLLNKSTKISVKQDGGESDAPRDLANELFMAKLKAEDTKDSSLNASLESLEHDDNDGDGHKMTKK